MSKIAEQKALEAYPIHEEDSNAFITKETIDSFKRAGYSEGYDQAFQDFMEKVEEFFTNELYVSVSDQICSMNEFKTKKDFVNYFKNYMQNEM